MKTIRLFDENSHLYTFTATVLSAEAGKTPNTLAVVLDATAFFPEGGGQYADPGIWMPPPVWRVCRITRVSISFRASSTACTVTRTWAST